MTDRSIMIRLGAVASGLKQGFKEAGTAAKQTATDIEQSGAKAEKAIQKQAKSTSLLERAGANVGAAWGRTKTQVNALTDEVAANREEFDRLGNTATIAGGLLVAGVGLAVKRFADFDQAMSDVAATGSDAKNSLSALRAEAIQLGADTQYSAQEAAQGIENLEKAGVSAKDILAGGLSGTLNLAAAGQLEVADAAEIAATALTQFGLSGNQMGHVADLIAAGAGKAQGEVSDLANALKYVGPVAAGMGISIEETTGALAAFASQGILSDQAGTSLRGVLAALTSPSKQAAAEIENLGISLYDSNGKFKGLTNLAGQLSKAYSGMSDQAKDASLGILFGNQQVTAARVLFDQGAEGVQNWTDKVNDAGYAARAAATKMDNLKGDIEQLSGSIDTALIQSGSGLNEMLRNMTQSATATVNAVGAIPGPVLQTVTALAGAGGLGLLGVGALVKTAVAASDAKNAMNALGISTKTASLAAGGLGIALGVGALAFQSWAQNAAEARQLSEDFAATLVVIDGKVTTTDATISDFNKSLVDTQLGFFGLFNSSALDIMNRFGISVQDAQGYLIGQADAVDRVKTAIADYSKTGAGAVDQLAGLYSGQLLDFLDKQAAGLSDSEKKTLQKAEADRQAGIAAKTNATAQQTINSYLYDQTDALGGAVVSMEDYETALWDAANAALKLTGTEVGFRQAVHDANKAIKARKGLNTRTEAGRANQRELDKILTAGEARVNGIIEVEGKGKKAAQAMQELRDAYIEAATAATGSKTRATELANALKLIPGNVDVEIRTQLDEAGMGKWTNWKPETKRAGIKPYLTDDELVLHFNIQRQGGPKLADGGILARSGDGLLRFAAGGLASIGSQQPQIAANRGPAGIQWAETGSGPWEGFVSGHPAKKGRSRAITSEIARRLDGDVVWKNADGNLLQNAMRMPTQAPAAQATAAAPTIDPAALTAAVQRGVDNALRNGIPVRLNQVSVIGDYVEGRIMLAAEGA